jgi:hypothetical protein
VVTFKCRESYGMSSASATSAARNGKPQGVGLQDLVQMREIVSKCVALVIVLPSLILAGFLQMFPAQPSPPNQA